MRPEIRETLQFLTRWLAGGPLRLLEVGAGEGLLAQALAALGHRVTALDADEESVEVARRRGLDARVARWPDFDGGPYDAVVFSHSLHHMDDLAGTVRRAREVLAPGGLLLAEEFDVAGADAPTLEWFTQAARRCATAVPIGPDAPALVTAAIGAGATLEAWAEEHGPDLHTAEAMRRAIDRHFDLEPVVSAPYLFRYLGWAMPETPTALGLLETILEEERRLGRQGAIRLLGRRFAGRARGAGPDRRRRRPPRSPAALR
jgi:SAM-dependent methyltransferase